MQEAEARVPRGQVEGLSLLLEKRGFSPAGQRFSTVSGYKNRLGTSLKMGIPRTSLQGAGRSRR